MDKKYFLLFSILMFLPFVSAATNVTTCGTTLSSSGQYELNQSISTANTCITITSSDVDLDCKGNTIEYANTGTATMFGIDATFGLIALNNITIRNCVIQKPTNLSTAGYGIRMQRTSNSYIFNNTISTNGTTNNYGLYILTSSNHNIIENNTINAVGTSTGNIGVYAVSDSNYNNITGNTINTYGTTTGYAVLLSTDSNDNLIANNNLSTVSVTTAASAGYTVYLFSSKRNDVINNRISSNGVGTNFAVYAATNANNNTIANNIINSTGTATTNYGIYVLNSRLNILNNNTINTYGTTTNHGIAFSGSYDSDVANNTIVATGTSTGNFGVYLIDSLLINVENNNISTLGTTTGYGISVMTSNYNNIRNNTISTNGTGATNTGILVTTSIHNLIEKNTISTWGTSANAGIFLTTMSNENTIANNTILARGTTTTNYGIYATQSQFNEIFGNTITTNGGTTTNYGIHFITQANRNVVANNVISTMGTTTNHGIFLSTASYNIFTNNSVTTNGTTRTGNTNNWGIYLTTTSNENEFYNGSVTTDGGGSNYGVYLLTDANRNVFQGNTINSGGEVSLNLGFLVTASSNNIIKDNIISTRGTVTNYGVELFSSSSNNLVENNNISTLGSTNSYGIYLLFSTPNYPINNNFSKNNLANISGNDLQVGTASINNTWLIDQGIGNYSFTGTSGKLNIKNTSSGEIKFGSVLSGTNTSFSERIYVTNNFARIDEYTTLLNKSAEITLYNLPTASTELQIIRNGVVCPTNICTNLTSMQAGNVTFNVTGGGNYSINSSSAIPIVTLNSPVDGFNASYKDISFNFTASDDVSTVLSCNLYTDSSLNQTNSSVSSGILTNFLVQNLAEGNRSWYVNCFDEANNLGTSETRNLSIVYTVPTIILNYPNNNSYLNDVSSIQLNYTVYDSGLNNMTVWFYGNGSLLNTSYNITNGTTLTYNWTGLSLGQRNWTVIANNGLKNSSNEYRYFNIINLTINCEAGGPYQEGALVLAQGNISDGTSALISQPVNASIYKEGVFNVSNSLTSLSDGSFQTTFPNLGVGNYVLNVSISYQGNNKSCTDSFAVGGSASFVLDKITSFYNVTNETISYNITLRLTNKGGGAATSSNISDTDSSESPYSIGTISGGQTISRSYIKTYTRNSTTYYSVLSIAQSQGINSYSNSVIEANSTQINITIPSTETGQQLTLVKNAYFNSENSTAVNYTLSVETINSGGEDLSGITLLDSDLNLNTLINLNRTQTYNSSSSIIIAKAASNTEKLFVKSTATINSITYESNQINVQIPGYGGPADTIVYAPASVSASTSFDSIIKIINQNTDIGQNFVVDYWITNNDETINYTSGQQTVYVAASSSTNITATLTSPSSAGTYRMRALTSYIGGPDIAFDSFDVTASSSGDTGGTSGGDSGGSSSSGAGITGGAIIRPEHLMDVFISVLEDYRIVNLGPDSKVLVEITFLNLGTEEIKDAVFTYCISIDNNMVGECVKETVAVQTKVQLVKKIVLPTNIKEGIYSVSIKVSYQNETVESRDTFEVREKEKPAVVPEHEFFNFKINKSYLIIGIIILMSIIFLTLILIIIFRRSSKHKEIASIESKLQHLKGLKTKGEISDRTYHAERERLLQRVSGIFKGKTMSIILSGIGLFALVRIFTMGRSVTGYVIGISASNNLTAIFGYFILLICAFGLLMFIHKQKIKLGVEKIHDKIKKKYQTNSIRGLVGKKVYSDSGNYIGSIKDIILGENRIDSLKIKVDKKDKFKIKRAIINYKHVKCVGKIIILDEEVAEHLGKLSSDIK